MLELSKPPRLRKTRVWFDEDLPALYDGERMVDDVREATPEIPAFHARTTAIEIGTGQPGHCSSYALLGAEYFPDESGKFRTQIHIRDGTRLYLNSLSLDGAFFGVPGECCDSVVLGLQDNSAGPPGSLIIRCGAHSSVGSSQFLFRWLSRAILRLLALRAPDRNIDSVAAIIADCRPALSKW